MSKLLEQPQMGDWQPYVFYANAFSKSECEAIIHIAKNVKPEDGITAGGADKKVRSSELRWLNHKRDSKWVFERLANTLKDIQKNWYPFHLSGFAEAIQVTKYLASENGHYSEHRDFGQGNMSTRKISLVMLLNDPNEFDGGQLEIRAAVGPDKTVKQATQGSLIAFPSWELHAVQPVTRGERWSMVCWVHGPPFV